MAREFPRTRRVGEQMRRDLAQLIRDEVRDPRTSLVSITSVEVSRDLAHAKVFVTYLGDAAERRGVLEALNQTAARLRQILGRDMHIRTVPRLQFVYDDSIERGSRLTALINAAVAADTERRRDEGGEGGEGGDEQ
ncbi:MAG TPA: 30S ribosome-binding factor RbfA [Candidatus Competibacteraceae bacterium]|nr:30S ribosome-binding factor RbfA [Candidatus Competibacteraceae bacterium]